MYALDYCAGIGGWELALRQRQLVGLGIENAGWPIAARVANGLETIWGDLTTLPRSLQSSFGRRVVGSFPCQPFSQNIKGGADPLADPRAQLMLTGLAHLLFMRPEVVCLENVAKAAPLMRRLGQRLATKGYTWDVQVVNAADYGLPQTRKRALLVARHDQQPVAWPTPTHANPAASFLVDDGLRKPWVTLAEAVGYSFSGPQAWGNRLPCCTVVGSFDAHQHAEPRYRPHGDVSRQNDPGAISLTLEQRLMVQGFPAGWQLAGPVTQRDLQVGNAIPPVLADVALTAAGL